MTGGKSPIGYLKAYMTNLYLSADSEKVTEAIGEGTLLSDYNPSSFLRDRFQTLCQPSAARRCFYTLLIFIHVPIEFDNLEKSQSHTVQKEGAG